MPSTISQTDLCNMALSKLGVAPIVSIEALDSVAAEQCTLHWPQALGEVGRAASWSCIKKPAVLQPEAQDPIDPTSAVPTSTNWAPATAYAVNDYVTFGDPAYLYQCLIANVSSASFTNDLTQGFWFQTDIYNSNPFNPCCAGSNYPSGWAYKYPLPEDCLLVTDLNEQPCNLIKEQYEIMGADLYTNESQAVIKYTWAEPDCTRYDALFTKCLILCLASKMATILRQDDTNIAVSLEQQSIKALGAARAKNAGEACRPRFSPVANSRFIGSRVFSTNS